MFGFVHGQNSVVQNSTKTYSQRTVDYVHKTANLDVLTTIVTSTKRHGYVVIRSDSEAWRGDDANYQDLMTELRDLVAAAVVVVVMLLP